MATPHDEVPRLPYAQIRPMLRSGDLLLCSGTSPMSKMIQAATGSTYSHVAMVWYVEALDRVLVFESVESIGVRAVPISSYVENYNGTGRPYPGRLTIGRHKDFPDDVSRRNLFAQRVADLLGTTYDTREIVAIALRIVAHKLGLSARPPKNNQVFICSEYAHECYKAIGLTIPYDEAGYIAPCDFVNCDAVQLLWEVEHA